MSATAWLELQIHDSHAPDHAPDVRNREKNPPSQPYPARAAQRSATERKAQRKAVHLLRPTAPTSSACKRLQSWAARASRNRCLHWLPPRDKHRNTVEHTATGRARAGAMPLSSRHASGAVPSDSAQQAPNGSSGHCKSNGLKQDDPPPRPTDRLPVLTLTNKAAYGCAVRIRKCAAVQVSFAWHAGATPWTNSAVGCPIIQVQRHGHVRRHLA